MTLQKASTCAFEYGRCFNATNILYNSTIKHWREYLLFYFRFDYNERQTDKSYIPPYSS